MNRVHERSIVDLAQIGASEAGSLQVQRGRDVASLTVGELFDRAERYAGLLEHRGYGRGSRFAVVGPPSVQLVTALLGVLFLGGAFSVVPPPSEGSTLAELRTAMFARTTATDADGLIVPLRLLSLFDSDRVIALEESTRCASNFRPCGRLPSGEDLAILQFTSGSTRDPRAVGISQSQLACHVEAIADAADLSAHDTFVSWLPLHHDMGLIGFLLLPLLLGCNVTLIDPKTFVRSPGIWMQIASERRATVIGAPDFAYRLEARHVRSAGGLDLGAIRLAINGAEPVQEASVSKFCAAARPHGFRETAMFPVFGMAEATLAVSFPPAGRGAMFDRVEREAMTADQRAKPSSADNAISLARLGRPIPGVSTRIVDPSNGRQLGPDSVGELEIAGYESLSRVVDEKSHSGGDGPVFGVGCCDRRRVTPLL